MDSRGKAQRHRTQGHLVDRLGKTISDTLNMPQGDTDNWRSTTNRKKHDSHVVDISTLLTYDTKNATNCMT